MTITTDDGKPCEGLEQGPFEPIAVIGVAAMMPDAKDLTSFWQNIIDTHVSIREIREGRWPGPVDHFWSEGKPGDIAQGTPMQRLVRLSKGMNSIGGDGDNLLERFHKLTLVNYGRFRSQPKPLNRQGMEKAAKHSLVSVRVLFLQMPLAEKIVTCPTSAYGRTILPNLPKNMECHRKRETLSSMQ